MSIQVAAGAPAAISTNGLVINHGPGTLYYRATQPVNTSTYDGTLTIGQNIVLSGHQFVTSDTGTAVSVMPDNRTQDQKYQTRVPKLVGPAITGGGFFCTTVTTTTVNQGRFHRVIVPEDGTLHDLSIFVGSGPGNIIGCIYDCGMITSGVRTLLYSTGSVAVSGSIAWQILGDPNLPVTAGQHLDFGFIGDNVGSGFGRFSMAAAQVERLPDGFAAGMNTVSPSFLYSVNMGAFAPLATISEGSLIQLVQVYPMIARLS